MRTIIAIAGIIAATTQTHERDRRPDEPAPRPVSRSVTTSYILGGIVHPLRRDGIPDPDRCAGDGTTPPECSLTQSEGTEEVAGGGGWLMQPYQVNDQYWLPEAQLAFRTTVTPVARNGTRLLPFSNTEVCDQGLTAALDGCAVKDGVRPLVRLHRQSIDTRIVSFDARKRELSWPTKIGVFILHLGESSANHVADAMRSPPNVFTVDAIVTMPIRTARGYEARIVQETRRLDDHWSADKPTGPVPDPLSYNVERARAFYSTPGASCPGPLEGVWRSTAGSRYMAATIDYRCGTAVHTPPTCPGCQSYTEAEVRYDVVGELLTVTYMGRTRSESRGDMPPPGSGFDVTEKTIPKASERWRILDRCPPGPINDPKIRRHLDSPRCLVQESDPVRIW